MFSHQRLTELADYAWETLRDGLCRNVDEFNREFDEKGVDVPLSFSSRARHITVRKTQYPRHILRILSQVERAVFLVEVESARNSVTEPTIKSERIRLEFASDGNLHLEFRNEERSPSEIANMLAEEIFKNFTR